MQQFALHNFLGQLQLSLWLAGLSGHPQVLFRLLGVDAHVEPALVVLRHREHGLRLAQPDAGVVVVDGVLDRLADAVRVHVAMRLDAVLLTVGEVDLFLRRLHVLLGAVFAVLAFSLNLDVVCSAVAAGEAHTLHSGAEQVILALKRAAEVYGALSRLLNFSLEATVHVRVKLPTVLRLQQLVDLLLKHGEASVRVLAVGFLIAAYRFELADLVRERRGRELLALLHGPIGASALIEV